MTNKTETNVKREKIDFCRLKLCGAALLFDAGEITEDDLLLAAVQYANAVADLRLYSSEPTR
jgi:hypothetical protein